MKLNKEPTMMERLAIELTSEKVLEPKYGKPELFTSVTGKTTDRMEREE